MTGGPPEEEPVSPTIPTTPVASTASSSPRKRTASPRQGTKKAVAATEQQPQVSAEPAGDPLQPRPVAGEARPGPVADAPQPPPATVAAPVPDPAAPDPARREAGLAAPVPDPEGPPRDGGGGGDGDGDGDGDGEPDSGYPVVEGIVWRPVHPDAGKAEKLSTAWSFVGALVAAAVFVLAFLLVGFIDEFTPGLVAMSGAVSVGALLVVTGLGLLQLEALRAETVRVEVTPEGKTATRGATATAVDAEVLKELRQGLAGLTAARAAIFAGAFLLAVAALGGGISLAGGDGDGGSTPTPTSTTSQSTPG